MHPIERLRYVARASGAPQDVLVQETARALASFSGDPHSVISYGRINIRLFLELFLEGLRKFLHQLFLRIGIREFSPDDAVGAGQKKVLRLVSFDKFQKRL